MITFSVNTYCLNTLPREAALKRLHEIGYRHIELVALKEELHLDVNRHTPENLGALFDKTGLNLAALYPMPINIHNDIAEEETLAYIEKTIDLAEEVGCGIVTFSPLVPRENYDYARLARGCQRLCNYIGDRPVRIALENHYGWPLDNTADYEAVFAHCQDPRLGITLDTGHFTASRVDMLDFIEKFGERIIHVHLKDHIGEESLPLGKGETDNPAVFDALRKIGFNGYASLELEVKDPENVETYLADALTYARNTLGLIVE